MSWKIRHEGSPQSVEGLSVQQVVAGLQDGQWEPTDEVMGPSDRDWESIENHPQFAEVAEELEPPPPKHMDDETRLDFTPLIDVCLVLLIFFILTASYSALERLLPSPRPTGGGPQGPAPIGKTDDMLRVQVKQIGDRAVITAKSGDEIKPDIQLDQLLPTLEKMPKRVTMLIDYDREVKHGVIVAIQDAAKALKMEQVLFVVHKKN